MCIQCFETTSTSLKSLFVLVCSEIIYLQKKTFSMLFIKTVLQKGTFIPTMHTHKDTIWQTHWLANNKYCHQPKKGVYSDDFIDVTSIALGNMLLYSLAAVFRNQISFRKVRIYQYFLKTPKHFQMKLAFQFTLPSTMTNRGIRMFRVCSKIKLKSLQIITHLRVNTASCSK